MTHPDRNDGDQEMSAEVTSIAQALWDEQSEFLSSLNAEVVSLEPGSATVRIPFDDDLANTEGLAEGIVNGGVLSTLIDGTGFCALVTELDDPSEETATTVNLNINYLNPAADDVTARAEVVNVGGSIGVARIVVESVLPSGEQATVASGEGVYRLLRPDA